MSAQEAPVPPYAGDAFTVSRYSQSEQTRRMSLSSTHSSIAKAGHGFRANIGLAGIARRTLGITLLLATVLLWTGSNFLASYIFADDTYSKPYFVTYINTSFFALSLPFIFVRIARQQGHTHTTLLSNARDIWHTSRFSSKSRESDLADLRAGLLSDDDDMEQDLASSTVLSLKDPNSVLTISETAKLSLEFCLLWFLANYFVAACLEYTTVASSTILTSTSSIWTLIFGALFRVESFTLRKLLGVLASLSGIALISLIDLQGGGGMDDDNRGSFPLKTQGEIALGDAMAFLSAILYGIYAIVMKKRIGNEDRVNMPLFFGLVGLFNVVLLWPGLLVLHWTGVETLELPPSGQVWAVVLGNSLFSFISDYCWAYAMLLTTPLVVTVGLSLTIPLSLIGQMIINSQYATLAYWAGAGIVLLSFVFINHESVALAEDEPGVVLTGEHHGE